MTEFALLLIALFFAAFFTGTETAFVAANRIRLEMFERKKVFGATLANFFVQRLEKTLSSTLVGKMLSLVCFASIMSGVFAEIFGRNSILVDTFVVALLLVFVADVVSKTIFRELADYAVLVLAPILRVLRVAIFPIIFFAEGTAKNLARWFGASIPTYTEFYRKQDFEILLRENALSPTGQQKDVEIISNVLSIRDVRVRESMVPRTEIIAVEKSASVKEVQQRFEESGYSRLPVYDETIDKIIGQVAVQDLFKKPKHLDAMMREILFVPETKKSVDLLAEFLQTGQSAAVVVDEFGGTSGLVTTEDLIEELVGDIQDEFDEDNNVLRALSENTYLISGRIEIERINEKFGLNIPKEEYETLAGYVLSRIGRIPKQSETLDIDAFRITISKATKTKIDIVKLTKRNASI
jgi:CBS domain containing-hemolysin-like protein